MLSRAPTNVHRRPLSAGQRSGGAPAGNGNLQAIGSPEDGAQLTRARVGIRRDEVHDRRRAHTDVSRPGLHECLELPASDVRDEVPESIDVNYLAVQAACVR
jgi:hypothetical protein